MNESQPTATSTDDRPVWRAELAEPPPVVVRRFRRRVLLPVILFVLTCGSTFWAGATALPMQYVGLSATTGSLMPIRQVLVANHQNGLMYMACLLSILAAHEMGHFLATVRYRIPASFPIFLPLPISPIGTLGAVITMDGRRANRREIFDIGIAGPLAGLVVAIPIMWYGVTQLELHPENGRGQIQLDLPLMADLMMQVAGPEEHVAGADYWLGHLYGNPFFMAGWVGLLITGLNMLPVSQLDGGHVIYCLFLKKAHWLARAFVGVAILYIALNFATAAIWVLMTVLILFIGVDHPPTKDDSVPLGFFRTSLGICSLAIPVLCFPLQAFHA